MNKGKTVKTTMENAPKEWKNLEDFSSNIEINRLPPTKELAGRQFEYDFAGTMLTLDIGPDELKWAFRGAGTEVPYECILVGPGIYFIDFVLSEEKRETFTVIMSTGTRRALGCRMFVLPEPVKGETMVQHEWFTGVLKGGEPAGLVPAPTTELTGEHAVYAYSPNHYYEHYYINSQRFVWHCLHGVQKGHSATEPANYFKFEENMYVLGWRELLIPTGTVFFLNFADNRSTGKFVGMGQDGKLTNHPGGARIQKICRVYYPNPLKAV